ncbi:MAG TPA: sulfurtransferase [Steroidobacteraceae bacterium]
MASPLVSATALKSALDTGAAITLLDARFDLADAGAGRRAFDQGHLPGAQYADLDRDLSGPKAAPGPAFTGRHPLPARGAFAATVGRWGIGPASCVVALDAQGSAYAARVWWLLRWLGHARVWVLDGGIGAWLGAGGTLTSEPTIARARAAYPRRPASMPTIDADGVAAALGTVPVFDARGPERYRGDAEPLDPVAGHIPGSRNRPFKDNLEADGAHFKPTAQLAAEFAALYGAARPPGSVHLCGSGVTACHNLLAMQAAGVPGASLYPGSWSEWCADPVRPVARGA